MTDKWLGGCQCGEVRYEVTADRVLTLYCCHCRDCQRQSSSAFGMSLIVPRSVFRLVRGALRIWELRTDRGTVKRGHFCPTCGVRIFHDGGEDSAEISVKAGSLDDTHQLRPVAHIWTKSAQPWVRVPDDVLVCEREPESDEAAVAAYRSKPV